METMTLGLLAILLAVVVAALAYAAGARAGYFRGLAYGQHLAGREMMHVLSHGPSCDVALPPASLDDLAPPQRRRPN